MAEKNEVHQALERLRAAEIVNKTSTEEIFPRPRRRETDGTLAVDQRTEADRRGQYAYLTRPLFAITEPFRNIKEIIRELSPEGLSARGIPFARALKVPRSVILASVVINAFGLALPLVILQVYDRIIPNQALETFSIMMLALATVAILEGVLRIARSYVMSWSATRFTKAITQELMGRFLYAPAGSFKDVSSALMIERLSNVNRVAEFYGGQSRLMFIDLPFAMVFLLVMGVIGGWLVIVPFVVLCLFGVATIASSRQFRRVLEEKEQHEARTYDFVAETLGGILTMKTQSAESLLMRRFERLQEKNARLHYSMITAAMQGQSIASLLGNGTMIAMVTTGAWLAVQGNMTVGVLACCSLLSGRAVQPILRVASTWNEFQRARLSVDEVSKLFELDHVPQSSAIEADPPTPEVVATNMRLALGDSGRALNDVNFTIESGEVIAIAGPDGEGKSSLMSVIAGMNKPTEGTITLDGQSAYDFRRNYKSAVGVSDAETEVFAGTIFENLSLFGQGGSAEDVRWATDILAIEAEIDRLPQGYDTPLGRGIAETLPAGFITRLMMARVLAQKPVLWVLDEPQSGLDAKGTKNFLNAVDSLRGWVTMAYTTNAPDYLAQADRIFYANGGTVTIFESYEEMQSNLSQDTFDRVDVGEGFDASFEFSKGIA